MKNTRNLVMYACLTAIIVLMGFTPLGYLKVGFVEITFITIPVIIGAILLGKGAGAFLGGIFGLTSYAQCFGMSAFGAALLAVNPISMLILCVGPRILMGFLCGLVFEKITNRSRFIAASLTGAISNTVLFTATMLLLFRNSEYISGMISTVGGNNLLRFVVAFVGINGLIEAFVCAIVGTAVSLALFKFAEKRNN